ncbi:MULTISPECIES: hypothetical protein [unclassified Streptomyces]|uniref:hypothetical protein n=1 Tax=unclassified Streptomyces TaxID=2593676 RepID=UPI0036788F82
MAGQVQAGSPKDGAGPFAGMAQDPVATAASNNPALSTLVTAVKEAGLVDTLKRVVRVRTPPGAGHAQRAVTERPVVRRPLPGVVLAQPCASWAAGDDAGGVTGPGSAG